MSLTKQQALEMFESDDLIGIGMEADAMRRRLHPEGTVTYIIDRNINYTNFCTEYCTFCAFYRPLKGPAAKEGYILDFDTIYEKIRETVELGGTGVLTCEQVVIINKGKLVATDSVRNLQARARGAESMVLEVGGRNGNLEPATVQQKLERVSGVSRVVCKQQVDSRAVFEIESQKGRLVRGDLARAVVESGWDLNELRPAAMSLEEVFLQLTGKEKDAAALPAATGAQV